MNEQHTPIYKDNTLDSETSNDMVNTLTKKRTDRETGFEILRIIAIFLISSVHVMNYGGMLSNAGGEPAILTQRLLYVFFLPSVNVFVLITGYFMCKSKFKLKKVLFLWLQVFAYSVIFYFINSLFIDKDFSFTTLLRYCFPICENKFWFFTAYIVLYLFTPFLNLILEYSSKKQLTFLVIGIFIFTYLSTRKGDSDWASISLVAHFNYGYSIFWFMLLYLIGGYFRLYPPKKIHKVWIFLIYITCTISLFGMYYLKNTNEWTNLIYNSPDYTSPLVLVASICLILLFRGIKIKNKPLHQTICFVSSCSFGIYLLQQTAIQHYLYYTLFNLPKYYGNSLSVFYVIAFALSLVALGLCSEIIRKFIVWIIKRLISYIKNRNSKPTNET